MGCDNEWNRQLSSPARHYIHGIRRLGERCSGRRSGQQRGEGKPETFNFLGFTHIFGRTRKGHFTVLRQTMRQMR